MTTIEHLPAELLLKIWHMSTPFEDSDRVENPVINWHSKNTLLFQHDLARRAELIATKLSIVLVCRLWNALAASWAYEHIAVSSAASTKALASALETEGSNSTELAPLVKRLDIEVVDLGEISRNAFFEDVAQVLSSLPNLITLTMTMPPYALVYHLLPFIPASVRHLFWTSPTLQDRESVHGAHLFKFFESHPQLETISFPFLFHGPSVKGVIGTGYRKLHPSIREWVIRHTDQSAVYTMISRASILPNVTSRTVTWPMFGSRTKILLGGTVPCGTVQNPKITKLSLVVQLLDQMWLPEQVASSLRTIDGLCPNLREFHLTYTSFTEDVYNAPMDPTHLPMHPLPQVKTVCIQRVVKNSELSDPIGTLHHAIRVPWRAVFPNIRAIRVHENINLGEVMEHPTMAFVREEGWTIRLEDRHGEAG